MKSVKVKIVAIMCMFILTVSLAGCKTEKKEPLYGTYKAEVSDDVQYCPTVSLFEDKTFQFNVGMGNYFKGTYTEADGKIELTLTENASKISDEEVSNVAFTKSEGKEKLVIQSEISGYVPSNTVFYK